jgi:hypothetical protein
MKPSVIKIILPLLMLFISTEILAQRHSRYLRRKERAAERIERADREGKLDQEERLEISEKKRRLHKTNRRALRDGEISDREQDRMNRRLRKVKRETRRSERD